MADKTESPDWESPAYRAMQPRWQLCRDVRGGTEMLRAKADSYLPRFLVEDPIDWSGRVNMTVVVDFLEQAITTFVGLGLRFDPELGDDVPPELVDDWENLDGEGNHGAVVAQRALDMALGDGHMVLLTEYPKVNDTLTLKQQAALGIRPYVVRIGIDQIKSWRTEILGGHRWLTQLVIEERVEANTGTFGSELECRYRVYRQQFEPGPNPEAGGVDLSKPFVTWELWTDVSDGKEHEYARTDGGRLIGPPKIPVAVVYGGQPLDILVSKPPLLGVAFSNVRWAQVMSDRANSLHKCGIPIPVVIGRLTADPEAKSKAVALSSSHGLQIDIGGDFKYVEVTGASLEQQRLELEDTEKRIGAQSLAMLQRDEASAETATAHRLNKGREQSKLARALRSLEDGLELTLQYMAEYRGLDWSVADDEGGSLTIRRDFGDVVPPEVLTLLSQLEEKGQLTLERLLTELQRAGVFGNDFDVKQEVEAVKQQQADEPMGLGLVDPTTGLPIAPTVPGSTGTPNPVPQPFAA